MSETSRETRNVIRNVYVLFFISGGLGLVYQILWLRKLMLVFGSTVYAVSTILTVFFGGLALGSWIFGRLIDRHEGSALRWYGLLEGGVGLFALISLPLFDAVQHIYIPIYRASGFSQGALVSATFVCTVLILLLPTTLLGATFPVLSRFFIRTSEERGFKVASIYGINTLGAMMGVLGVYYIGLPMVGLVRTMVCAGLLSVWICVMCLVFERHLKELGFVFAPKPPSVGPPIEAVGVRPAEAPTQAVESPGALRWLLVAFGLSGFSAMAYEVAWTRALAMVLGSSIYAFCIMLATFLGGIALGSLRARRDLRNGRATVSMFIQIELLLGCYGIFSIPLLTSLPEWFVMLWPLTGKTFTGMMILQAILCATAMLLPTLLMGLLFPVVSDLVTRRFAQLGQRLGTAYAINTVGGIFGSFLAGFLLIPVWGLQWAVIVAALVNVVAGLVLYARFGKRGAFVGRCALSAAALAGVVVFSKAVIAPMWHQQVFTEGVFLFPGAYKGQTVQSASERSELLYYRDSLNTTVSVHQRGKSIYLKVGGKTDASNGVDMGTQVLSAHIPMLLHPDPKRVLVIGLGSGVTLGSAGLHATSVLDLAEIDEAVIEGARFFKDYNYAVHDDPRTSMYVVDGRNFLMATQEQYDILISEPSNPWMAGLGYLFTREFYQLAKQRLAPGGVMCQWLQLYRIFPGEVKLMLKTFHEAFPHVTVWSSLPGDLLMVGSMEPLQLDFATLEARMADPRIQENLARVKVDDPSRFLQLYLFGSDEIDALTADVNWIHEDNLPWLEFNAPKALYVSGSQKLNLRGLERFKGDPRDVVTDYDASIEDDPEFQLSLGKMYRYRNEPRKAEAAFQKVVEEMPDSPEAMIELGQMYMQRQALRAEAMLKRAAKLEPSEAKVYYLLAQLSKRKGDMYVARDLYIQAARLEAPNVSIAAQTGWALKETDALPEAAEFYRSAISQGGGERADIVAAYAEVLRDVEDWLLAERVLRFGMSSFQKHVVFPLELGELLLDRGRLAEAEPFFERVLVLNKRSSTAHVGLGRVAMLQGDIAQAARSFRRALRFDPYNQDAAKLLHIIQAKTQARTAG